MNVLNIELSGSVKDFVESRVAEDGHPDAAAYVHELIHTDQNHRTRAVVDALLIAGLDSGEPVPAGPDFWAERRRRLAERHPQPTAPGT